MRIKYLIRSLYFIMLFLMLVACVNREDKHSNVYLNIDVENREKYANTDVFNSIEIIPMETNEKSLIGPIRFTRIVDNKFFIFVDESFNTVVFDKKGQFVSNSLKAHGAGPEEYYTMIDLQYNHSLDCIEVLTQNMDIIRYDTLFNYLETLKIPNLDVRIFHNFLPIDSLHYLLMPGFLEKEFGNIYLVDFSTKKENKTYKIDEVLAGLHQNNNPIRYVDGIFIHVPQGIVSSGYTYDPVDKLFSKSFSINMGKQQINSKDPKLDLDYAEVDDYLVAHKEYALPLNTLFNERYIATRIKYKKDFFYHVFDRNHGAEFFINEFDHELKIPEFINIHNNSFYAVLSASEVNKYVEHGVVTNYVDTLEIDENPCVAIYNLKEKI